jgi:hypothetical protein
MRVRSCGTASVVGAILIAGTLIPTTMPPARAATPTFAVGPPYDTTHVYVAPGDFDRERCCPVFGLMPVTLCQFVTKKV